MDRNQEYDTFRVAFASSDGYVVDTHFGRATSFYIYQYFEGEYVFVEERKVTPVCLGGEHSTEKMKENEYRQRRIRKLNTCRQKQKRRRARREQLRYSDSVQPRAESLRHTEGHRSDQA